jgi:hypothetical protein
MRKIGTDGLKALNVRSDPVNQACVFGADQQSKSSDQRHLECLRSG